MTIEEIMQGESKNIEFKAKLPKDSEKYIKTIFAFANTQGGCLVIGVDDLTRKVTGVDRDFAFQIMDSIANAVADSCVPQIVPNIELQTIEGRTVVVVTVIPEPNRPYYLKSKGKEKGTYIRLAGTSRPADSEKIKELELEGAHISWDELPCIGYDVTDKDMNKLCKDIVKYRKTAGLPEYKVTSTQLVNWKLLKKLEKGFLASNAFVLLVSDFFHFLKRNVHCHRNLTDASCVQVAVYDDRLEVTSPGGLYNGLTYEEIMNGHSKIRNRAIANVFNQMGLVEAWGTGIRRIKEAAKDYGLSEPKIMVFDDMFRVNLYRSVILDMQTGIKSLEKHRDCLVTELNDTQIRILDLLSKDAKLSAVKLAEQIGVARRNVEANIKKLKERGILIRHGSPKNGYWEIVQK